MPHASCSILCPDHLPLPVLEVTAFSVILSSAFSSHSAHVPWVTMSTPLLQLPSLQIRISGPPQPMPSDGAPAPHVQLLSGISIRCPTGPGSSWNASWSIPNPAAPPGLHLMETAASHARLPNQKPRSRPLYSLSLSHPCAPCIFLPTLLCSGRHSKVPQTA